MRRRITSVILPSDLQQSPCVTQQPV